MFKKITLALALILLFSLKNLFALNYVENEILIKTNKDLQTLASINNLKTSRKSTKNIYKVILNEKSNLKIMLQTLKNTPGIIWAQPNYIYKTCAAPNDPLYSKQWNIPLVHVNSAWETTKGKSNIVVAVVDTGVDYTHEDLENNIWANTKEIPDNNIDDDHNGFIDDVRGWDFVSVGSYGYPTGDRLGPRNNNPMDFVGHGTFVSGIIAATINNAKGIAGIAPGCLIMPVRAGFAAYDDTGHITGMFTSEDAGDAIKYAGDNGASVINLSWGGQSDGISDNYLKDAVAYALAKGSIVVAAAGNEKTNIDNANFIPASYDQVIAVSAVDSSGSFDSTYSNYGSRIDIAAPGTNVLSTLFDSSHNNYEYDSGTSFAAPHVSGIIGLILSENSSTSTADVYKAITLTADQKSSSGKNIYYGYGLINAKHALSYVITPIVTVTELKSGNKGLPLTVTANIVSQIPGATSIKAVLNYSLKNTTNWQSLNMTLANNSSTLFEALIPTPSIDIADAYYYIEISDFNPAHTQIIPSTAPQTAYHILLDDVIGPTISSVLQSADYVNNSSEIAFEIKDNTVVSPNTIVVTLKTDSSETTYDITNSNLKYSGTTLTINLAGLSLTEGNANIKISAKDIYNNSSNPYSISLFLTTQNSEFILCGPNLNTPVINYPNPFNPRYASTLICFMISKSAKMEFFIYSLNLDRVKHFDSNEEAGYHEIAWDGRDEAGDIVPPGVYLLAVKATADGKSLVKRTKIAVVK